MATVKPNRQWKVYVWVTAVISAMFLAVMVWQGLYPFGDRILANSDGVNQYINFYAWFRDGIREGNGLKYSFSAVLGGNMQGVYAYYLGSPLYFLMLLFPQGELFGALHLIIGLKILCGGLCFCAWTGRRKESSPWLRIAFSVSYAWMGYVITFYNLLSWLDGVALLPLVAMGVEKLVEERKPFLYIGALGLTIMANYYVGFMVCIASVLFYVGLVATKGGLKQTFVPFALSSLSGGALSGWILLPGVLALPENRIEPALAWDTNFPFFRVFSKLFTGTTSAGEFFNGLPVIFVGMIPLIFLILFYLNPQMSFKGKMVLTGGILILLFSFWIAPVNLIWHGLSENRMFNYRYSFVLSFLLLGGAWYGTYGLGELSKKTIFLCTGILVTGVAVIFSFSYAYGSRNAQIADVLLLAMGMVAVVCIRMGKRGWAFVLLLLVTGNSLCNAGLTIRNIRNGFTTAGYELNTTYGWNIQEAKTLLPTDEGFYRVEKTFMGTSCDNMAFQIPGLTNFTSLENPEVLRFVQQLGMQSYTAWARYVTDSPASTDALLGIRYLMTPYSVSQDRREYGFVGKTETICVYENPYALPILMASKELQPEIREKGMLLQNECWSSLVGDSHREIFVSAPLIYEKEEGNTKLVTYRIPKAGICYLQIPEAENWQQRGYGIRLLPEEEALTLDVYLTIYELGSFEEGEEITLELIGREGNGFPELLVCVEDKEMLARLSNEIGQTPVTVEKVREDHLVATCTVGEDTSYMASTIPYDEGWRVTVDGKPVSTEKNWNCMLAFPITPGEHRVELHYEPPGKTAGMVITLLGGIMTVATGLFLRKRGRTESGSPKRRKGKTLALLLMCLAMLCTLCGCNSKEYLGKYKGYYVEAEGNVYRMEDYFNGDNYLELKNRGKAVLMVNDSAHDITWEENEGALTFEEGEETFYGYINKGVIVFDYMGWGMEMTFALDGAEVPETTMQDPEAFAEAVNAVLPYWNGDWYGWWYISEGTGAYASETMKIRDLAGRIELEEDARGSLLLWDMEHPYTDPLGEVVLRIDPTVGGENIGIAMSGQGTFMGQPVLSGDWLIDPSIAAYDNLLEIYGYYSDEKGDFFYSVFLRPWGRDWEDIIVADDPSKSPADLPVHYELYLEALLNNTKPEDFFS